MKNDGLRIIWQFLKTPVAAIYLFCLILCTVILLATFHVRAFNSDDVIWQNALLYWKPFHHQVFYSDAGASYIGKIPIYWLISQFMSPGRGALLAAGLLFTLVNFTVIYFSTVYLLKRAGLRLTWLVLLPFVWLASFGYGVTSQFVAGSLHNIEIGAIFLTFAILVKIYYDRILLTKSYASVLGTIIFVLFLGVMIADDHYFLFICTLPAIAFVVTTSLLKLPMKRQNMQVFIILVTSLLVAKVIDLVATKSGIILQTGFAGATTPQLIGFESLLTNIIVAFHSLFIIFGADFWGRPITQILLYVCLANAALLAIITGYGVRLSKNIIATLKTNTVTPFKTSIPTLIWAVMAFAFFVYVITTMSLQITATYHYLMVIPYFAVPLLCWLFATRRLSRYLYTLIILSVFLNTGSAVIGVSKPSLINEPYSIGNTAANDQAHNLHLVAFLEQNGLTKGFGGYADGNINTYLSKGKVNIMPTICSSNAPQLFHFLFTQSQLIQPSTKSFYLYNPLAYPFPNSCTPSQAEAIFGQPAKILHSQGDTILVYDHDISTMLSN